MGADYITDISLYLVNGHLKRGLSPGKLKVVKRTGAVIAEVTALTPGKQNVTNLKCWNVIDGNDCPGHISAMLTDVPCNIRWSCTDCDNAGLVLNWRRSPWDLSDSYRSGRRHFAGVCELILSEAEYRLLLSRNDMDMDSRILVKGAQPVENNYIMYGASEDLENIAAWVLEQFYHETDSVTIWIWNTIYMKINVGLRVIEPQV